VSRGYPVVTTTGSSFTVQINYTDEDIEEALQASAAKSDHRERAGSQNYGKKVLTAERIRANRDVGDICEFLGAWYFKLPFDASVGPIDNVDLKIVEVRGRRIERSREFPDLAIRPKDKMHLPNVLMRLNEERREAHIVGWLCAWQAMERPIGEDEGCKIWCDEKGVYYIRPPYHSVASLEQYLGDDPISKPPKPLWMPADFDIATAGMITRSHPFA